MRQVEIVPLSDDAIEFIQRVGCIWIIEKDIIGRPFVNAEFGHWVLVFPLEQTKLTKKIKKWINWAEENKVWFVISRNERETSQIEDRREYRDEGQLG